MNINTNTLFLFITVLSDYCKPLKNVTLQVNLSKMYQNGTTNFVIDFLPFLSDFVIVFLKNRIKHFEKSDANTSLPINPP